MQFLKSWVQQIVIALVLTSLLEMLLPGGRFKKYVRVVMGFFLILILLHPLLLLMDIEDLTIFSIQDVRYETGQSTVGEIQETRDQLIREEFARLMQSWINNLLTAFPEVEKTRTELKLTGTNIIEHLTVRVWLNGGEVDQREGTIRPVEPVRVRINQEQPGEMVRYQNKQLTEKLRMRLCNFLGLKPERITVLLFKEKDRY